MANVSSGTLEKHYNVPLRQLTKLSYSHSEHCDSTVCSKPCFARSCFDWCLTHSHPSVEDKDGTVAVTVQCTTKDAQGQVVHQTTVEQRQVCGAEDARVFPGDCKIVTSPFVGDLDGDDVLTPEDQLWQFEQEQRALEMMARESP